MERKKVEKSKSEKGKSGSICPSFGKCGGCQYIDMDYREQLDKKYKHISKLLGEFGKVETILGMEHPYHYRNKNTATFKRLKSGEIIAGTYEEGSHRVVSSEGCMIEDERAGEIIETIKALIKSFKLTVHNEDTGYGLIRHVMTRTAHNTGEVMVVIVTSSIVFPSKKNFARELVKKHPYITTIIQNVNDRKTNMVLGGRNEVIYGKGYIDDVLCGKEFRLSPGSFYQINSVQTEVLYNKAIEFAELTGWETVIDAYCGIGTIGIVAGDNAKEVISVELNKDAVRDAINNARRNKCRNVSVYANDAGKFMVGLANQGKHVDVVFMDPPRSGSNEDFMSSVIKLSPDRVVYISCGPESLARDLKYFVSHSDYRVSRMVACDLFPWTEHVEVVCLLSKKP
ncbi:MAG: 23S rRNA (uracil(1939)-C(5))-methyltransferase RlmD [Wujia sp.]